MGVSWEGDCCGYLIISEIIVKCSEMCTYRQTPLTFHSWQGLFALCFMGLSRFQGDPRCESMCCDEERVGGWGGSFSCWMVV